MVPLEISILTLFGCVLCLKFLQCGRALSFVFIDFKDDIWVETEGRGRLVVCLYLVMKFG